MHKFEDFLWTVVEDGEVGGAGGTNAEDENQNTGEKDEGGKAKEKPTFSELLKDKEFSSEFDSRVSKAINTAVENAKQKWDEESKLTAEELAERALEDREKALNAKEQDIRYRESLAEVTTLLAENDLPKEFGELIVKGTNDEEDYVEVIRKLKGTWDEQLAEQLRASARQPDPRTKNNQLGNFKTETNSLKEFAEENRKIK